MDFPGGWHGDEKNAFTGTGLSRQERDAQTFVRELLNWRKDKTVIHSGKLMQFTPIKNIYAYFRYDENDTVMVVFNRGDEAAAVETGRFAERIGNSRQAVDVITGETHDISESLTLGPRSVLLLELTH